jgi:hypothetical protein
MENYLPSMNHNSAMAIQIEQQIRSDRKAIEERCNHIEDRTIGLFAFQTVINSIKLWTLSCFPDSSENGRCQRTISFAPFNGNDVPRCSRLDETS